MACNLCGHTMQNLGVEGQRIFWCPRCGTLKTEVAEKLQGEDVGWEMWEATKLGLLIRQAHDGGVERYRDVLQNASDIDQVSMPFRRWRDILEAVGVKTA